MGPKKRIHVAYHNGPNRQVKKLNFPPPIQSQLELAGLHIVHVIFIKPQRTNKFTTGMDVYGGSSPLGGLGSIHGNGGMYLRLSGAFVPCSFRSFAEALSRFHLLEASNLQRGFQHSSYPGDEDAFELWWAYLRNWMLPLLSRDGSDSLVPIVSRSPSFVILELQAIEPLYL
ncbi:hypothetical protein U1Q18_032642 [Sarracenia purpurea var. burkii]